MTTFDEPLHAINCATVLAFASRCPYALVSHGRNIAVMPLASARGQILEVVRPVN